VADSLTAPFMKDLAAATTPAPASRAATPVEPQTAGTVPAAATPDYATPAYAPAAIEGVLRRASAAVQGRHLAASSEPRAAEAGPSRLAGATIADATVRVDAIAVQASQGGQQASIGLAPAIADPAAAREGTVAAQLVRAIRIQVRDGIGEAKLTLRPDHLGEVSVQLRVDKDRVSATLIVERADVRTQIEGQRAALRSGLEAQGLHLDELIVREDGERRRGGGQEERREESGRRRRQPGDKTFDLDDDQ